MYKNINCFHAIFELQLEAFIIVQEKLKAQLSSTKLLPGEIVVHSVKM